MNKSNQLNLIEIMRTSKCRFGGKHHLIRLSYGLHFLMVATLVKLPFLPFTTVERLE